MRPPIVRRLTMLVLLLGVGCAGPSRAEPTLEARQEEQQRALVDQTLGSGHAPMAVLPLLDGREASDWARAERLILDAIQEDQTHLGGMMIDITLALRLYGDRFSASGRRRIEQWLVAEMAPGSVRRSRRFVHTNDNTPLTSTMMLIVGGAAIDRADWVRDGIERLEAFLDLSRGLGLTSEYNSPTYSAFSLLDVEAIASLSAHPRARVLARVIAEILWNDVALRYHAPTSSFAAPRSRSYINGTVGVGGQLRYTLAGLLPGGVLVDARDFPRMKRGMNLVAENSLIRHFLRPHHVEIFLAKAFPHWVRARKYRPGKPWDADPTPAGEARTVTYQTETYAVGSAERPYGTGAGSTPFQVHWTPAGVASSAGQVRTLYERYRRNGALPDVNGSRIYDEDGVIQTVQWKNTALLLYRPRLDRSVGVERLEASLLVPHGERVESILAGSPPVAVTDLPATFPQPVSVFLRDGAFYLAIHPLEVSNRGRGAAMRIERRADHLMISAVNVDGSLPRTLGIDAVLATRNGFAIEVGDAGEYDSFDSFLQTVGQPQIQDVQQGSRREVRYARPGRTVEVTADVEARAIESLRVDGTPVTSPILHAPQVVTGLSGIVERNGARLVGPAGEPLTLVAVPTLPAWVAVAPYRHPAPLRLETPGGVVRASAFGPGRIEWSEEGGTPLLTIDSSGVPGPVYFSGPGAGDLRAVVNDQDVTAQIRRPAAGQAEIPIPDGPPLEAETELGVTVRWQASRKGPQDRGGLEAVVQNSGSRTVRDVVVTARFSGFSRPTGPVDKRIAAIAPGGRERVQWALRGRPRGLSGEAVVTVTARNAPTKIGRATAPE